MKWTKRQKITLVSLFAVCTLIVIYALYNNGALQAKTLASFNPANTELSTQNGLLLSPTPDVVPTLVPLKDASFNPADYGLPSEIGGYQIRVALSFETRLCNPSTDLQLYLYAIPNQPQTLTTADIQTLKDLAHRQIQLSFVSWPISMSEIENQIDQLNAVGCFNFGGPVQDYPTSVASTGLPPQNHPIIPPTPDTGSVIMPPTAVMSLTESGLPTQNGLLISPTPNSSPIPTATIDPSYEPAYWGLPAQVGGYEIMVVTSSENQKCSPPNQLQLLLHAIPGQPQTLTTADIQQLETLTKRSITLMFSSGEVSIQQVQSQMKDWNAAMAGGCIRLGGPIPSFTPNPDDPMTMTSYDPKFWSLPETIAGYKVLAVKSVENSECAPNAVIQLVLQMSPSEVANLTKTTYDEIMSELNKLGWKVDWLIGYVPPGTSKTDIVSVCAPNLDRDKLP